MTAFLWSIQMPTLSFIAPSQSAYVFLETNRACEARAFSIARCSGDHRRQAWGPLCRLEGAVRPSEQGTHSPLRLYDYRGGPLARSPNSVPLAKSRSSRPCTKTDPATELAPTAAPIADPFQ